jgi:hypothetical protein
MSNSVAPSGMSIPALKSFEANLAKLEDRTRRMDEELISDGFEAINTCRRMKRTWEDICRAFNQTYQAFLGQETPLYRFKKIFKEEEKRREKMAKGEVAS